MTPSITLAPTTTAQRPEVNPPPTLRTMTPAPPRRSPTASRTATGSCDQPGRRDVARYEKPGLPVGFTLPMITAAGGRRDQITGRRTCQPWAHRTVHRPGQPDQQLPPIALATGRSMI